MFLPSEPLIYRHFHNNLSAAENLHTTDDTCPVSLTAERRSTMKCDDLTPAQAERLKQSVRPILSYLNRLKKRMEKRRFPNDDRLFLTVLKAYDAIHELNVHVHYLSCESGVGRQVPTDELRD
jgi:hypothetical protein